MSLPSLPQHRAKHALEFLKLHPNVGRGEEGGKVLPGFSALIQNGGLLAAGAFAYGKSDSYGVVLRAICAHLHSVPLGFNLPADPQALLEKLANDTDSTRLRRATEEALRYLPYLVRFQRGMAPAPHVPGKASQTTP